MPGERKRVTRAESQQRTKEELLDAAEVLFFADGLHGTTVAKIAAAAGRTQGAIYANFSSKENLCAEVLLRCYLRTFTGLIADMAQVASSPDRQIDALGDWYRALVGEESLIALAAEYALAVHKDPDQMAVSHGHIEMGRGLLGAMLSSVLSVDASPQQRDMALLAVMATGTGLAFGRTLGVVDDDQVIELLTRTLRLWAADLEHHPNAD